MVDEIEVKFLDIDLDDIRNRLDSISAICEQPMRLMRRAILDYPDGRLAKKHAWVRIRDEGDKTTTTYKQDLTKTFGSAKEIEITVGDYETTINIFQNIGMVVESRQESRRETWKHGNVEIVLDIWPWINPYIEIEGPSKAEVEEVAKKLGLDWSLAKFGSVTVVYKHQYPNFDTKNNFRTIKEIAFNLPASSWLTKGNKK